jgi:hypothetical protein
VPDKYKNYWSNLCTPQQANYKGTGDTNDATNFACAPEK